ncbi:SDR family oxidoreductase [Flexivirga meconopsidis]|uniref:SDR family oxidoreductase n=1 Tax=Flexivirga meconopsidis TaxID=2977121 RepID=UPI00223FAC59|nr:SDR family oxidoreductase [Flexivirga meconopsidis]
MTALPRTALVTASTVGIGRAIAQRLITDGVSVTVHGRDSARAAATAGELGAAGAVAADATTSAGLDVLGDWLRAHPVDILVNALGPFAEHDVESARPEDWLDAYRGNVVGAVELARIALPHMRSEGFGRVIFLGTRATRTPIPTMIEYSAAKAALANATISLARSATAPGVTVNMVSPGVILTPSLRAMFADRPESAGRTWEDIEPEVTRDYAPNPMGRLGRPEDIAAAVSFLCGSEASYINGVDLPVDGGITGTH